tara:strand:- start:719 stop:934 length:216 start_codon:yes stop_codon:yes gene_type:complete
MFLVFALAKDIKAKLKSIVGRFASLGILTGRVHDFDVGTPFLNMKRFRQSANEGLEFYDLGMSHLWESDFS